MALRVSLLNGANFSQDYDFSQTQSSILTEGVGSTSALEVLPQDVPDDTVKISAGVACIEVTRTADGKTFKVWGENTAEYTVAIQDTGVNPTYIGAVVAVIPKAAVQDGNSNAESGTGVFDIQSIAGTSTSPLSDSEINTAIGSDYEWIRLADVVQDPTIEAGDITDTRIVFGFTNVNLPNDWPLRWKNNAGDGFVNVMKVTTGDIPEFQTVPRHKASRVLSNDNDLIDIKYFQDNVISQTKSCTLGETCAAEDVVGFLGGGYVDRNASGGGSLFSCYGSNWAGNYFVAPDNATHIVGLRLGTSAAKTGSPAGNINMSIYLADGSHKPTGAALATVTKTANSWNSTSGFGDFKLTTPLAITGGQEYVLVWNIPSGDASNNLRFGYATATALSGDKLTSTNGGATWTVDTGKQFGPIGLFYKSVSDGKVYKADMSDPFKQGNIIGNLVSGGNADDVREFNHINCVLTGALQDDGNYYVSTSTPGELLTTPSRLKFGRAVDNDVLQFSPNYEHQKYYSQNTFGWSVVGDGDLFIPLPFKPDSFEIAFQQSSDPGGGEMFFIGSDDVADLITQNAYWSTLSSKISWIIGGAARWYGGDGKFTDLTSYEVTDHGIWLNLDGTGTSIGPYSLRIRARKN